MIAERFAELTGISASVPAGDYVFLSIDIPLRYMDGFKLIVTPSVVGGTSTVEVFSSASGNGLAANREYGAKFSGAKLIEPMEDLGAGAGPTERRQGVVFAHQDDDQSGSTSPKLYLKISNGDVVAKTYDYKIDIDGAPRFGPPLTSNVSPGTMIVGEGIVKGHTQLRLAHRQHTENDGGVYVAADDNADYTAGYSHFGVNVELVSGAYKGRGMNATNPYAFVRQEALATSRFLWYAGASVAQDASLATPQLNVEHGADGTNYFYAWGANAPWIVGKRAQGTPTAPTQVLSGNALLSIFNQSYHSGGVYATGAEIDFVAAENWTNTARGTNVLIKTVAAGATAQTTMVTVTGDAVGIGTTGPSAPLHLSATNVADGPNCIFTERVSDLTAVAAGVGGGVAFTGKYTGSTQAVFAAVQGYKENATDNDFAGAWRVFTRSNGGQLTANLILSSSGVLSLPSSLSVGLATQTQGYIYAGSQTTTNHLALEYAASDTNGPIMTFMKARGNIGGRSIVSSGDTIGQINFNAIRDNTTYQTAACIAVKVDGTPGAGTDMPGRFEFYTTPDGSATPAVQQIIYASGLIYFTGGANVKISGSATRGTTEGTNHLDIFDGTAPVGTLANGISLYSTSGELRVMDSGGTATLLSSHSRKTGEWIHDSYNVISHKRLIVQAERMAKFIDEKFGTSFVEEIYGMEAA